MREREGTISGLCDIEIIQLENSDVLAMTRRGLGLTSMLGQSALLRISVVGMSVSVNSSSRSTTYAILPGRKSSFLSVTPDLNTTR